MRKILAIIIAGSGLAFAPASYAGTSEGQTELGIYGQIASGDLGDSTTIAFTYGWFMSDSMEWILSTVYFDSGGTDTIGVDVGMDYHFNTSADWVPYVGAGIGTYESGGGSSLSTYNVRGGMKGFVSEQTAIKLEFRFDDLDGTEQTSFNVGVNVYFGG